MSYKIIYLLIADLKWLILNDFFWNYGTFYGTVYTFLK